MNVLLWFLFILFCLYIAGYLLMPIISRMALRYLNKKAQEAMQNQSRAYDRNFQEGEAFADNIEIDKKTKVKVPKGYQPPSSNKTPNPADIEEVEFEEID